MGKMMSLFSDPKYKEYSKWDKFNSKFQIDLIKVAEAHTYYITGLYFQKQVFKDD